MKLNEIIINNHLTEGILSSFVKGATGATPGPDSVENRFIKNYVDRSKEYVNRQINSKKIDTTGIGSFLSSMANNQLRDTKVSSNPQQIAALNSAAMLVQQNYNDPVKYLKSLSNLGKQIYSISSASKVAPADAPSTAPAAALASDSLAAWKAGPVAVASTPDQVRKTKLASAGAAAQINMNRPAPVAQPVNARATPAERAAALAAARAKRTVTPESKQKIVKKWGEK